MSFFQSVREGFFPGRRPTVAPFTTAFLLMGFFVAIAIAADEGVTVGTTSPDAGAAQAGTTDTAAPPFKPEDISIGEPISLPFATPLASPAPQRPPATPPVRSTAPQPTSAAQLPSVIAPAAPSAGDRRQPTLSPAGIDATATGSAADSATAGTGWLGIAVDDALVTGRLVVVEVAADGPAARAGIRPQDMLLAIDGNHLQTGDELAAALAAIAPGQRVRMAIGRETRVEEFVALAAARPPEALSRDWQSASAGQTGSGQVAAAAGAVPPFATAPPLAGRTQLVQAPDTAGVLPAPRQLATDPDVTPPPSAPSVSLGEMHAQAMPALPSRELPAAVPPVASPSVAAPTASSRTAPGVQPVPGIQPVPGVRTALGVRTVPVDPNTQSRFRLPEPEGAFVIGVVQDLPASRAGLPPGSVIVAINHQPVRSPSDLTQLVSSGPVGTPVPLQYVLPGGQSRQAEVVLQSLEQPLARALGGDHDAAPTPEPPSLQPAPQMRRRVDPAAGSEPAPATALEELVRRINNRLQQLERRLERLEPAR